MRKVRYYSLVEVMAVCGMFAIMGTLMYVPFHKFNRDFRKTALRNPQSAAILYMHRMQLRATAPAKITDGRIEFPVNGQSHFIPVPEGLTAAVSLESDGKLQVLTLTDGKKQYYRMVAEVKK